jgi:23S rRNA (pseudouridine1915-N3)-methyltransferase
MSSVDFSKLLQRHLDQGTADLAFLIGGPDGHRGATWKTQASCSLGEMTWPHRLVRVVL